MLAVNVVAAGTEAEARRLHSSQKLAFARLRLGMPGLLPAPLDDPDAAIPQPVRSAVEQAMAISAVGMPDQVAAQLQALIARHRPEELILVGNIFDQAARQRSFAIAAEILRGRP